LAATCTAEPNELWVTQQARNLRWKRGDEGIKLRFVIHDRDRKFAPKADTVFRSERARVIVTPLWRRGDVSGSTGAILDDDRLAPFAR
jgi:hypothetical protein